MVPKCVPNLYHLSTANSNDHPLSVDMEVDDETSLNKDNLCDLLTLLIAATSEVQS